MAAAESTEPPSIRTAHVRVSVAAKARGTGYQRRRTGSACASAYWGIERARRASDRSAGEQVTALELHFLRSWRNLGPGKYAQRVRSSDLLHSRTLSGTASIPTSPESARAARNASHVSLAPFQAAARYRSLRSTHLTVPMRVAVTVSMPTAAATAAAM